jgi:retinol dehydrogenase 13
MDNDAFRDTYRAVNERFCPYEKTILTGNGGCSLARKFCIAEREGVQCDSSPGAGRLSGPARSPETPGPLRAQVDRHPQRPAPQQGHAHPGRRTARTVRGLGAGRARPQLHRGHQRHGGGVDPAFGTLDALPYSLILREIAHYQPRKRQGRVRDEDSARHRRQFRSGSRHRSGLAAAGWRVGLVARDRARGEAALAEIQSATGNPHLQLFVADLASQAEVRALAESVLQHFDALHLLVNNAGTAFRERRLSPDGIERALAVNHLAPFLLTHRLLDRLTASAPAQIINVGTRMNTAMDLDDWNWERRPYRMMAAYGQSKLGNLHFTFELARRLAGTGVRVNCVFPGVFRSNLGGTDGAQGLFWRLVDRLIGWALPTPERAARGVLRLASTTPWRRSPAPISGMGGRSRRRPRHAIPRLNRRVWALSLAATGLQTHQATSDSDSLDSLE